MPNYTTNLNLEKPLQSEQYNIDVFNANADKIDQFAGQVPARALTADKLTTGAKINGVNFKGDTDIVTGAGFYYDTVTYGAGNLAFIYNQGDVLELYKSLSAGNIGHNPLTSTGYWEKVDLGGGGSGYQMFDIVMKDHVLNYEETLGLAPLGSYVYKEAIAGTRYGYPDFYAGVVAEYQDPNNTTDTVDSVTVTINANGHKFYDIANKATFDNIFGITGECWYYGIDTTNERIFLPRSTRFKNGTSSDVGGYQAAGLPNITGMFTTDKSTSSGCVSMLEHMSSGYATGTSGTGYKLSIDASVSSSIYGNSNTVEYASTKLIPYMVVGNQSTWSGMTDVVNQGMTILSQVNAGLATKVDLDGSNATFPYITETYKNGSSWYRVYSDGWCEQGGKTSSQAHSGIVINLLKPYTNSNYTITISTQEIQTSVYATGVDTITNSSFKVTSNKGGNVAQGIVAWRTDGYIR